jgi:3-oxoacyl-[acyl-carrier protein] reductase
VQNHLRRACDSRASEVDLSDTVQNVIVTGGKGSLAQAIAQELSLLESGWQCALPTRQELDVGQEREVEEYFQQQKCDLLIAAAGEIIDQPLWKMHECDWDRLLTSNLKGAALCAKWASRQMLHRGVGHILFVSSFSALHPPVGQVAYASAKAGLLGLMKSLAKEWGSANIRVNAILPGFLENRMTENVSSERKLEVLKQHSLQRFNTEQAVAAFVHTLHTRLVHTSGQVFQLDSRVSGW